MRRSAELCGCTRHVVLFLTLGVPRPAPNGPTAASAVRQMMGTGLVNSKDGLLFSNIPNGILV